MPRNRSFFILAACLLGTGTLLGSFLSTKHDRTMFLRFSGERQAALRKLGLSLRQYAIEHDAFLPPVQRVEESVRRDAEQTRKSCGLSVRVEQSVHFIPSTDPPNQLVLVVERYPDLNDAGNVLFLGGDVTYSQHVSEVLRKDAALRLSCGLPPSSTHEQQQE